MQLHNCELLPGVIEDVNDPKKLGRIKCVIPGYVDPSFSKENMPWVRPLSMYNHQCFSKPIKGYKVWVLVNKSNYNEYWYFPFFELNDVSKEFLESTYDKHNPEVIISHNCGGNHATFTYDEENGFSIRLGQHHIKLHPDGKITILGGDAIIELDGTIKIGKNGQSFDQPAVLGDKLDQILSKLLDAFNKLNGVLPNSPALLPLSEGIQTAISALNNHDEIKSNNININ